MNSTVQSQKHYASALRLFLHFEAAAGVVQFTLESAVNGFAIGRNCQTPDADKLSFPFLSQFDRIWIYQLHRCHRVTRVVLCRIELAIELSVVFFTERGFRTKPIRRALVFDDRTILRPFRFVGTPRTGNRVGATWPLVRPLKHSLGDDRLFLCCVFRRFCQGVSV